MSSNTTKVNASPFGLINDQLRHDLPNFSTGDTIRVDVKIKEGEKYRIQGFEGVVIKTQGQGITSAVTVRKASSGVFVERTFPLHSPIIDRIDLIKRGRVRRSRIYYLRNLKGKAARIKEVLPTKEKETRVKEARAAKKK